MYDLGNAFRYEQGGAALVPKVQSGALGGAIIVVLVWVWNRATHMDLPGEVASALTVITLTVLGYLTPSEGFRWNRLIVRHVSRDHAADKPGGARSSHDGGDT